MNQTEIEQLATVPPWVRSFMVHVVKRCCGIIINWITEMQNAQACQVDVMPKVDYNGSKRLRE